MLSSGGCELSTLPPIRSGFRGEAGDLEKIAEVVSLGLFSLHLLRAITAELHGAVMGSSPLSGPWLLLPL